MSVRCMSASASRFCHSNPNPVIAVKSGVFMSHPPRMQSAGRDHSTPFAIYPQSRTLRELWVVSRLIPNQASEPNLRGKRHPALHTQSDRGVRAAMA
jgi:hypothetical protein